MIIDATFVMRKMRLLLMLVRIVFVRDLVKLFLELQHVFRQSSRSDSIMDWFCQCADSLSKECFGTLLVMLWFVWKERKRL